jgi:5'-phosphate synthase pdxT subunit
MKIGVLALQGAFIEHIHMLDKLHVESFEIRQKKELNSALDGIIIPGGESTVIGKLLDELDMFDIIKEKIESGLPVFGTCAGLILLAAPQSENSAGFFGTMNIVVRRNAYGRQLGSFRTISEFIGLGYIPMTFIRAPYIERAGENVEILAEVEGKIVAARQGNQLVTAFHPELDEDPSVHKLFLSMIKNTALGTNARIAV